MPRSFTDNAGRSWTFAITIPEARRIRTRCGVDLLDPEQLRAAASDLVRFIDLMFAALEPQAKERNITDEQFGVAIEGHVDDACDALQAELADFFRRVGRVKAAEALEVGMEAGKQHADAVNQKLDRPTLKALIEKDLAADMAKLDAAIAAVKPGAASPQSQPSPDSA